MTTCNDVLDDLADIVAGDSAAISRHAEHLASCDACRDLRHDVESAAGLAAHAGDDYVPSADLASRVLAKIDDVPAPKKIEVVEATPAEKQAAKKAIEKVTPKPIANKPSRSRAPVWLAAAAAAAAVVGGSALMKHHNATSTTDAPHDPITTPVASKDQIGTIASVARASSKTDGGITVKTTGDWKALKKGDAIPAGATLKTDDRTRVSFTLTDGSTLTLDHDTEISFASADARQMKLAQGRLVADVTHDEKHHASITTPSGAVNILGTKLVVTATAAMTSVQTVRGEVSLTAASGAKGSVRAGEEGVMENGAVNVASTPSIANELAWTNLEKPAVTDDDLASGLGSLKAYKPGEKRDRDWNMALAKHDVKVRISGPIARTEITETFRNDSDTTLEGRYQFPLPSDAQIDGLALDSKDAPNGFIDGAFVDKSRGQKIFQGVIDKATPVLVERPKNEIIWVPGRWRDPALLDWQRGGRFQLKIYPIPAHGSRTIKIAYTQVVGVHGSQRRYVYPLAHSTDGSTVADQMSIDVEVRGAEQGGVHAQTYALTADPARTNVNAMTMSSSGFVPKGDLVIDYKAQDGDKELRAWTFTGGAAVAPDDKLAAKKGVGIDPKVVAAQKVVAGDARPTAVLALRPHLPRSAESKPRDVMIVIDSSQSMVGERYTRASNLAVEMIGQMDRRDRFSISACDSECATLGDMRTPTQLTAKEAKAFLTEHQVAGASDIVQSIRKSSDFATEEGREKWVIFVGDGFASTGFRKAADVEHALASVTAKGVSVSTIGIGGDADATVLASAARGGGGSFLAWTPGESVELVATTALDSINGAQLRDAKIELPEGLADAAPTVLPTVRSGEEVLLAARMTSDVNGKIVVTGMVGNEPYRQEYPVHLAVSGSAGNGFVPRLWASLAIAQLERRGEGDDRIQTIALSQGYGVMSKDTSLLVLESDKMFDAFGVDRTQPQNKWTGEDSLDEVVADGALALDTATAPADAAAQVATGASVGGGTAAGGDVNSGTWKDELGYYRHGAPAATKAVTTSAPPATPAPVATPAKEAAKTPEAKPAADKKDSRDMGKGKSAGPVPANRAADRRQSIATDDLDGSMYQANMIPMRRIWVRIPSIAEFSGTSPAITKAVADAEDALAANPDSREKHRALVQALAYAGDIDRAKEVAAKWLDRDRMDPQALGYTADLLGRDGQRELALRTLAGLVDLDADSIPLHQRMIGAYEAAGRLSQACSHRIAVATIQSKDLTAAGAAMRCLRAVGRDSDAELIRKALPDDQARSTAEKAATVAGLDRKPSGDLVMNASWQGNIDLDISLVTPSGERVSWMGGRTDAVAKDASSNDREALALRSLRKGNYLLEITRGTPSTGVIRGTIDVTALGQRRSLPFELTNERSTVGRIAVNLREQWVRVDDPRVNPNLVPVLPTRGGPRRK
ncbi:MAG TPA: FecR domain-containing protein [Kofleriaceae bacterium]|jgi:ferric-dicitrate binding protein FerR (iron transport regulator)/tetratricopeptide (TPR) repeat protein